MYKRAQKKHLLNKLREPRRFVQVVYGPRQVGKTIMITQLIGDIDYSGSLRRGGCHRGR